MSASPMEPTADMRQMANMLRQMFIALKNEGFTEQEALKIIGQTISAGMAGGDKS